MPKPKGLKDACVIIVRRGENMRVQLTVTLKGLKGNRVMPPEMALEAARLFIAIQDQEPGRADMPIVPGDTPFGLVHRDTEYVMDPRAPLWVQLDGHWEDQEVEFLDPETGKVETGTFPCVVLMLDDIERMQ